MGSRRNNPAFGCSPMWRTHSCVPRRDSSRRFFGPEHRASTRVSTRHAGVRAPRFSMRTLTLFLAAAVCLSGQRRPQFNDGDAHGDAPFLIEEGWTPLLNGRDVSGWPGMNKNPNEWFTATAITWDRLLGPTRLGAVKGPGDRILNGPQGRTVNLVNDQKFGDV